MRVGILYDEEVMSWPLLSQLQGGYVPAHSEYLIPEPVQRGMREWLQSWADWKYTAGYQIVAELPWDQLDGLLVLRAHPERFGGEITRANALGLDLTILTLEEYRGGQRNKRLPDWMRRALERAS